MSSPSIKVAAHLALPSPWTKPHDDGRKVYTRAEALNLIAVTRHLSNPATGSQEWALAMLDEYDGQITDASNLDGAALLRESMARINNFEPFSQAEVEALTALPDVTVEVLAYTRRGVVLESVTWGHL